MERSVQTISPAISGENFRDLFLQSPSPVAIYKGSSLVYSFVNEAYARIFHHREILGKPLREAFPELEGQGFYEIIENVYRTGEPFYATEMPAFVDLQQTGRPVMRYYNIVYTPFRDDTGSVTGVMATGNDVTDGVWARQKAEESGQLFRNLIEQSPFPVMILRGPELLLEMANRPLLRLFSIDKSALGTSFADLVPCVDTETMELLREVYRLGVTRNRLEVPCPAPEGSTGETAYYNFVYQPYREADGTLTGVMVLATDVTEEVKAKLQLGMSSREMREALDAAEMGYWTLDPVTMAFHADERFREWFGLPENEEHPHAAIRSAIHEKDRERVIEETNNVLRPGSGGAFNIVYTLAATHLYPERVVRAKGKVFFDEAGAPYWFSGTIQDITKQQAAEEAARSKSEELEFMASAIPHLLWAKEPDGYTYFLNKRWNGYTGLPLEALKGWGWMQCLHPDDLERVGRIWSESIRKGEPYEAEYRLRCHRNEYKWFKAKGVPMKDRNGTILRWYGTSTDIHQEKVLSEGLEALVEQRTEELNRSNQQLEQFAHVASHDMKEPIRKVKMFSERIQTEFGSELPERAKDYLRKVQGAADRLGNMVQGVLNYATIGAQKIPFEPIDLNETIRSIENDLELLIGQKGAKLQYSALPSVEGASFLLYQLFYNLVNNSLKFCRPGLSPEIRILGRRVKGSDIPSVPPSFREQTFAEIVIEDNGIGFGPEHAGRIFDTFIRLNARDQYEGTGMGLALVKRIALRHNGFVRAEGQPGAGATFTVLLPEKGAEWASL